MNKLILFIFLFILSFSFASKLEQHEHQYKENDDVHVWVNTIGPYSNPSETYSYYKLPFCKPADKNIKRPKSFGESLSGEDISSSLYQLKFKESTNDQEICTKTFDAKEIESLIKAIRNNYYFEFIIDDLPVRGFIGAIDPETSQPYLFLHLNFLNLYNGDRIIHSNITMDNHKILNLASDLDHIEAKFSYSVEWAETEVKYKDRLDLYQDSFFEQELEIHWLSVLNSFVLVLLLAGFVILILMRVLKADYVRYEKNNVEEPVEDYGWKLLHGDVFRVPGYDSVLSSLLGAGVQFFFMILGLLLGGIGGIFDLDRMGTSEQVGVFLYALTSVLGGFFSATVYSKLKGKTWHWNLVLTACIFSVPLFIIAESINLVAWYYGTSSKFSFGTIILILMIWLFIGFPLTIIGGIAGKRLMSGELVPPTKVSNFTREIPEVAWYRKKEVQFILSGFLPFSAIYIELYYIFESVWGYKAYTLFGILMIVFVILLVVTSCVSITMTYFQLSLEDWKWGWWSFFNGASTGIFIFAYSIFYYVYKSSMTGLLQTLYFFGYMFLACYFFFILLGTVSFLSSFFFVYHIYSNIKVD